MAVIDTLSRRKITCWGDYCSEIYESVHIYVVHIVQGMYTFGIAAELQLEPAADTEFFLILAAIRGLVLRLDCTKVQSTVVLVLVRVRTVTPNNNGNRNNTKVCPKYIYWILGLPINDDWQPHDASCLSPSSGSQSKQQYVYFKNM